MLWDLIVYGIWVRPSLLIGVYHQDKIIFLHVMLLPSSDLLAHIILCYIPRTPRWKTIEVMTIFDNFGIQFNSIPICRFQPTFLAMRFRIRGTHNMKQFWSTLWGMPGVVSSRIRFEATEESAVYRRRLGVVFKMLAHLDVEPRVLSKGVIRRTVQIS